MKVLVTGASGQLGAELCTQLATGISPLGAIPAEFHGANVLAADLDSLDITDRKAVRALMSSEQPDIVFNCAAMTQVDLCETELDAAMRANAIGPRNMAESCAETGALLLHVSTDYVFSGEGSVPYAEWDTCAPASIYGKSKRLGEEYVCASGCRHAIIRTAWLYGRTGHNFVRTMQKAGRERDTIRVVNDQRGNPTNASDLAWHMLCLAAAGETGIFHITGNGECSWYEFAREIMRLSGLACEVLPCTSAEYPSAVKRPTYSALSHGMLRVTIGDRMRPWREALADFLHDHSPEGKNG